MLYDAIQQDLWVLRARNPQILVYDVIQDLLFYWLYFDDRLYLWEYIIAYPPENIAPRFVANIYCQLITNNNCGFIAYKSTNIAYKTNQYRKGSYM